MKTFLFFCLNLASMAALLAAEPAKPASIQKGASPSPYEAMDFTHLLGVSGISDKTLEAHFKLYGGYVKNSNLLLQMIEECRLEGKERTPACAELKRRFGFEFDGMRLHELYFANLGGKGTKIDPKGALYRQIVRDFGSYAAWEGDFRATGEMRGIGWAILYFDTAKGRLINVWIDDHQNGHLAAASPLLIMDIWEHAYMLDYGIDRPAYIDTFMKDIDWRVVEKRFSRES